jgi:CheY-like chemotaxis protein
VLGYSVKNTTLVIFVKDSGIGIAPDKQLLIFERFRQADETTCRKYGGAGLGLSITKGIIDLLHGSISVESEENNGTTFQIEIPINKEQPHTFKMKNDFTDDEQLTWKNATVLVVEDVMYNYELIKEMLEPTQIKCIHAENGSVAVDVCKTNPNINVVLMDLQMPVLNGFEATKQIKDINKNLPIIAQTAYAFSNDKVKAIAAGCDDYLTKPFSENELLRILKKFLS